MSTMTTTTENPVVEKIKGELFDAEMQAHAPRLTDLMRIGSKVTTQAHNWGEGERACALSASALAAEALGVIE